MSAKHTPGPWEVDDLGNVSSQAVKRIAIVFAASTREGWSGSDLDTLAHCEANARLIAAAPEQNKALIGLLELVEELDILAASNDPRAIAARAAIAKANGEQQ